MSGWFPTWHPRHWMALLPGCGPTFTVCVTALTISLPFESWKLIIYRLGDRLAWSARWYSHHFRFDASNFHNKILAEIGWTELLTHTHTHCIWLLKGSKVHFFMFNIIRLKTRLICICHTLRYWGWQPISVNHNYHNKLPLPCFSSLGSWLTIYTRQEISCYLRVRGHIVIYTFKIKSTSRQVDWKDIK